MEVVFRIRRKTRSARDRVVWRDGLSFVPSDCGVCCRNAGCRVIREFAVALKEGVLFLWWAPGLRITHALAVEAAASLRELSDGRVLPLVVVMRGIDGVTLETRLKMNAYDGFSRVGLVGDGPVDEILAGFAHQSVTPTRYFTSEAEALSWIEGRPSGESGRDS